MLLNDSSFPIEILPFEKVVVQKSTEHEARGAATVFLAQKLLYYWQ